MCGQQALPRDYRCFTVQRGDSFQFFTAAHDFRNNMFPATEFLSKTPKLTIKFLLDKLNFEHVNAKYLIR